MRSAPVMFVPFVLGCGSRRPSCGRTSLERFVFAARGLYAAVRPIIHQARSDGTGTRTAHKRRYISTATFFVVVILTGVLILLSKRPGLSASQAEVGRGRLGAGFLNFWVNCVSRRCVAASPFDRLSDSAWLSRAGSRPWSDKANGPSLRPRPAYA